MVALQNKARAMRDMKTIGLPPTPLREVNAIAAIMRETTQILRERQEQQVTLVQELNHRVKNTLATVQSISRLTLKNTADPESFDAAFSGRLLALSQTHNLLTETAWSGVALRELLKTELKPFLTSARVMLEGPDVNLTSKEAVALGMAIHELATNATKYGALHSNEGSIRIRWSIGDELTLEWLEDCGRKIAAPSKEGFGTRLIRQTIVRELEGQVEQRFGETGVHVTIRVPGGAKERRST
jgi:two-component sensor histidine kinase